MNLLELWWLLEKPDFQEVGSGFHKKFDQLLDHNWFSCESVDARDCKTFSWNCRPLPSSCNFTRDWIMHNIRIKMVAIISTGLWASIGVNTLLL